MSRLTPWNRHPRACVLVVGEDYSQTIQGERIKAAMAAILANVWIFNAMNRAKKERPMGSPIDTVVTVNLQNATVSGDYLKSMLVGDPLTCHVCGKTYDIMWLSGGGIAHCERHKP